MGCGGSKGAADPDAKIIKVIYSGIGENAMDEGAEFLKCLKIAHYNEDGMVPELPKQSQDDASMFEFKIKGLHFRLSAKSAARTDDEISKANCSWCFASLPAMLASEEAWKATLADFSALVNSSLSAKHSFVLILTGKDKATNKPEWMQEELEGDIVEHAEAQLKAEKKNAKQTVYSHSVVGIVVDKGVLEFFFKAIVAMIIHENLRASGLVKS